jgi:hypothetical protein
LASKKGRNKGGGKLGNKNGAKGPRLGRKDKTSKLLPQPRSEAMAKLPKRRKQEKTPGSGRDFPKGQNSHTGEVHRRGPDMIPRGNGTLMLRAVFHDIREKLYGSLCELGDTPDGAYRFMQMYLDRTEGKPGRAGQAIPAHSATFVLMTREGQEMEMLPPTPSSPSPTAGTAVSAEDALILQQTAWVRPV